MLAQIQEAAGVQFQVTLTRSDKFTIIESMLEMTLQELRKVAKHKDTPVFVSLVAKAIVSDFSKKTMSSVDVIFNRVYGKPNIQAPDKPKEHDPMSDLMK